MSLNWSSSDYFSMLMHRDKRAHQALEMLVDDIHAEKERTINKFLCHSGSEDFLWGLVKLLSSDNSRVAGNSAYILGTIAESEVGSLRVIALTNSRHAEARKILRDLTEMLTFEDAESVMNAAGTMGTLAESPEGRTWMLAEPCFAQTIINVTNLLTNDNQWTASNAALVLARITIAEEGCCKLLNHELSSHILTRLVGSLGVDEAGKGMNAAFAIGRICDIDEGRKRLLGLPESEKMISNLAKMLCCTDPGSSKNACFALSCLATSIDGHARLLGNSHIDEVLRTLTELLSSDDPETGWFAAMTLHTLASQPRGCLMLRDHTAVVPSLTAISCKTTIGEDMLEEVHATLAILKRLSRPGPLTAEVKGPHQVELVWPEVITRSGFEVRYQVFDGVKCVYSGMDCQCLLKGLEPYTKYTFRVRAVTEGDESPFSDVAIATTDESLPGPPVNVRLLGATATQLKIGWEPPESPNGVLKGYHVYLGRTAVEHTHELSCILTGLHTSTSYEVYVCAATSKGKGPKSSIGADTADTGAHCPSKPQLSIMGRNEIHLSWHPPEVPIGRINRYDVIMNSNVIYSGTELHHTARRLTPNTEYTFTVCALTNEGRFDSKEAKKKTPKNEYDPDRVPLYHVPVRKDSTDDPHRPVRRKKSVNGIHDEARSMTHNRLSSATSSRVLSTKQQDSEVSNRRPISATSSGVGPGKSNVGRRTERTAVTDTVKERLSSGKSSKSTSSIVRVLEAAVPTEKNDSDMPSWERNQKPASKKCQPAQVKPEQSIDSGSDSNHEKKIGQKEKSRKTHSSPNKETRKMKMHNSTSEVAQSQLGVVERAKSDTAPRSLPKDLLPNSASRVEMRGQRSDHDRHNTMLNKPINLTGVKSVIDNDGPSGGWNREASLPQPDPSWIEMTQRFSDLDNSNHRVNVKYEAPQSPAREEPCTDYDPPAVGKVLPIPHNFVQRANTFISSHRPSKKIPKQLAAATQLSSANHSTRVKLDPELPFNPHTTNSSKFIPMALRTPQLKTPGANLQRGNTSLSLTGGGIRSLAAHHTAPHLALRLDGISRSQTQIDGMKGESPMDGMTISSTKISSGRLVKGNSRSLRPVDRMTTPKGFITDINQW